MNVRFWHRCVAPGSEVVWLSG